jgi:hypothetical protein
MSLLGPNHWFYNTETGQLQNTTTVQADTSFGPELGWKELNIPGSDTGIQAVAAAKAEFPQGKTPSYAPVTPAKVAAGAVGDAAGSLGNWTISGVSGTNLAIRAAKVIIGAALLIIGLAHITGSDHVIMQAARKVPLPI